MLWLTNNLPERIRDYEPPEGQADNEIVVEVERIKDETDKILPMAEVEKRAIEHALRATKGNVPAAARKLQIGQATIYRKIKSYSIQVS